MAIKVIKHGKETFKAVCPVCGCEFSYQAEDLKEDRFHNHYVECPDCKQVVSHEYEVKKKDITWIKDSPVVDYKLNYPYMPNTTWTTTTDSLNCATCPNKPDPNKLVVGDTPCTWCKKNQPYCISDIKCTSESSTVNPKDFNVATYINSYYTVPEFTANYIAIPKSYSQVDCKYTIDTKE